MSSNPPTYPLRDIPVPYRYSSSSYGMIDLYLKSQTRSKSKFTSSSKTVNKNDISTGDIHISSDTDSKNVNDLVPDRIVPSMDPSQTVLLRINEKRARETECENSEQRKTGIKKIKLLDSTNANSTGDRLNIKEFPQENAAIINSTTATTVLDDPLPLSPIASSGLSTPNERDLNELNDIGNLKEKNFNNNNNNKSGILLNNHYCWK